MVLVHLDVPLAFCTFDAVPTLSTVLLQGSASSMAVEDNAIEKIKQKRRESAQRSRARKNSYMRQLEVSCVDWLVCIDCVSSAKYWCHTAAGVWLAY
jgi:hypothetical protein